MIRIEYGIIENTRLYIEEHYCLVLDVDCRLKNDGYICFGGTALAHYDESFIRKTHKASDPTNYCGYYITRVLRVFGEDSLDALKNKPCRIIFDDNNKCVGIMNYLDDTKYFIPTNDLSEKHKFIDPFSSN